MIEAGRAQLDLPDGREIHFEVRRSTSARSIRIRVSARRGLIVIAPRGLDRRELLALVANKAEWIAGRLSEFDAVRHLISTPCVVTPQAFDLPALSQCWRVEYKTTRSRTVGARIEQPGRIVVAGAVDNVAACNAALRRWLARHATDALTPWLANLAERTGERYTDLSIKNQRTRWGSCSRQGRITLNCKLLFLPRELVRYVMAHELCHLHVANHSEKFWAYLRRLEPNAEVLHGQIAAAWRLVPAWAQREAYNT